jgi:hypothetical protein
MLNYSSSRKHTSNVYERNADKNMLFKDETIKLPGRT